MIEMNAAQIISNPINIRVKFADFNSCVVINGNLKLGEIYTFLCDTTYILESESNFYIGEIDYSQPLMLDLKKYNMRSFDKNISLKEVVGDFCTPILIIKRLIEKKNRTFLRICKIF